LLRLLLQGRKHVSFHLLKFGVYLRGARSAILVPVSGRIILVAKGINGMGLSSKGDAANAITG
jgi:hypothetical protein